MDCGPRPQGYASGRYRTVQRLESVLCILLSWAIRAIAKPPQCPETPMAPFPRQEAPVLSTGLWHCSLGPKPTVLSNDHCLAKRFFDLNAASQRPQGRCARGWGLPSHGCGLLFGLGMPLQPRRSWLSYRRRCCKLPGARPPVGVFFLLQKGGDPMPLLIYNLRAVVRCQSLAFVVTLTSDPFLRALECPWQVPPFQNDTSGARV